MNRRFYCFIFFISLFSTSSYAINLSTLDNTNYEYIKNKYGTNAVKRVKLWNKMIESSKNESILNKIKNVNDFFNKFTYKEDLIHWRKKDYWATPFEFMVTGAGDSQDYAIAKYYSLIKLGIPKNKLKILQVEYKGTKPFKNHHVVLNYFHNLNSEAIVLDNIEGELKLTSKRPDLRYNYQRVDEEKIEDILNF